MDKIGKIKNINLSNLSPTKQLRILKIVMFSTVALLVIINFVSLGITGSNFMIWKDMQTQSMEKIMNQDHKNFFTSQQLIIAFDVLCIGMVLLLTFSVFKFYTKGNLIILVLSVVFWIIRWSSSIFFLSTDDSLQQQNNKKYSLIFNQNGEMNPLCKAQECTGQLLNYVQCGKVILWKQLFHFQIGYLVLTIIIGAILFTASYKTNQLDVGFGQNQSQLAESN